MDENTKKRRNKLEYSNFSVIISVDQELKSEFKVNLGSDATMRVEYD